MNTKNSLITMSMFAGWLLKYSDWYVWALALACLYAILQIKLDFAFWIVNNDRADVYNEIIVNLSYSYLAGFIFFLLTVTLPHRKMRTERVSKRSLHALRLVEMTRKGGRSR